MIILTWIKTHKLVVFLILIIGYLVFSRYFSPFIPSTPAPSQYYGTSPEGSMGTKSQTGWPVMQKQIAPQDTQQRVVVKNSDLSLVVNNVQQTGDDIISYAKRLGGFMVSASYTQPNQSPYAQITVRVPTEKLEDALFYYRSLAQKVVSENLIGTDVTDQYTNIQTRLDQLRKTQTKFNDLLDKAVQVQDIVTIQRELENIQQQIDFWMGQQKSLDQNAKLTLVIINLSTDELALPYTPDTSFRPQLVFKLAIRSLVTTTQSIAGALIWLFVYSALIIPIVIIYGIYRMSRNK